MDAERDREARAAAVYARIEILTDELCGHLSVAQWLRLQLGVKEAMVASLKDQIDQLHAKRNAIFHEGDSDE